MVLYTKISIATSKDWSHRDTVAHVDIKLNKVVKRGVMRIDWCKIKRKQNEKREINQW